jgi:hypothetical protein
MAGLRHDPYASSLFIVASVCVLVQWAVQGTSRGPAGDQCREALNSDPFVRPLPGRPRLARRFDRPAVCHRQSRMRTSLSLSSPLAAFSTDPIPARSSRTPPVSSWCARASEHGSSLDIRSADAVLPSCRRWPPASCLPAFRLTSPGSDGCVQHLIVLLSLAIASTDSFEPSSRRSRSTFMATG